MSPRRLLPLLLALLAVAAVAPALASRRPTASEARAIRAAAVRTLHGAGWRVSAIRVSTARSTYRYAKASVTNRATGVGGEMILRRRAGRWARIFLGTNDFCTANAPRRVLDDLGFGCSAGGTRAVAAAVRLHLFPTRVRRGHRITFSGSGFAHGRVELLIGVPRSEGYVVATTRAGAAGTFRRAVRISARAKPGRYVALACQRQCRVKASASFRIVR